MAIININKKLGQTPLEAMNELRSRRSELKDSKMVYAGRLDPMAEGVLLVLTDDDRFKLDDYLGVEKEYEATFLFGVETDTFDALGIANVGARHAAPLRSVDKDMQNLLGVHKLPFPAYSSYKVKGKPLHMWARAGKLDEIEIPLKKMEVLSVSDIKAGEVSSKELLADIEHRIGLVKGDFRQDQIIKRWRELLSDGKTYQTASVTLKVTSGTYIRSLAHEMGAILLKLKRTKVGEFEIEDAHINQ